MTLHPQAVAYLAADGPPGTGAPAVGLLAADRLGEDAAAAALGGPPVPLPVVREVDADGVTCRLYDPRAGRGAPVTVFLHGGGWVAGSLVTLDAACRRLADRSGCAVFSIGYRLAPEHPWPAQIDDVERAVGWLRGQAVDAGLDVSRLAIAGDSAGGTLAAVIARRARDAGTPYRFQALIYPPIRPPLDPPAGPDPALGAEYGLSHGEMAFYWSCYRGALGADGVRGPVLDPAGPGGPADPDLVPSAAASLAGLPPTLLITAEYDVLCAEGEEYGDALAAAGVPMVATRYLGMPHGFFRRLAVFDAARAAVDQVAAAIRDALDPPTAAPR
jgi:acetyl esterase